MWQIPAYGGRVGSTIAKFEVSVISFQQGSIRAMFTTVVAVRFNTRPRVNLILSALYQARGYKIMMLNLIKSDDHPMIQILVQGLD